MSIQTETTVSTEASTEASSELSAEQSRWRLGVMCSWEPALGTSSLPVGVLGWVAPDPDTDGDLGSATFTTDWIPVLGDAQLAEAADAWQYRLAHLQTAPHRAAMNWAAQTRTMTLVPVAVPPGKATLHDAVADVLDDVLVNPVVPLPA